MAEIQELFRKHAEFLQNMLEQQNITMKSLVEKFGKRMNGGGQSGAENPVEGGKGGGKEGGRNEGKDNWAMYKGPQQEGTSSGSAGWKSGRCGIEKEKVAVEEHKEDRKDWANEWEEGMRSKSEIGRGKGYQGACWKCGTVGHK